MLRENIRLLRKQKGMSQEVLAQQLNVVRQTVSKWEKGLSVPDADMLMRLAEQLDVPVEQLLGKTVAPTPSADPVADQLALLNEQLAARAGRWRRAGKAVLILLAGFAVAAVLLPMLSFGVVRSGQTDEVTITTSLTCTLDGETYHYGVTSDAWGNILSAGGDERVADWVNTEQYSQADELVAAIEEYFTAQGGSVTAE